MAEFNHFDQAGNAVMVDVTDKTDTHRVAVACGTITMTPETLEKIKAGQIGKGDVLGVARVAGIMAAKKTSDLIPMCHPLFISGCKVDFEIDEPASTIHITAQAKITGKTGVEMEALTAVSVAALTIYDMCKAVDKRMLIGGIHLVEKEGGKSGHFIY